MVFVHEDKKRFTLSESFISDQKCSQFLSLPLSSSSSSFNFSVRENNEWDSFAPAKFPSACCSSLILCPHQKIVCRQCCELVRARQAWHHKGNESQIGSESDCGDEMTVAWLSLGRRGKCFHAKIWVVYMQGKFICAAPFNSTELLYIMHKRH